VELKYIEYFQFEHILWNDIEFDIIMDKNVNNYFFFCSLDITRDKAIICNGTHGAVSV
jgi:hypothetical protein